MEPALRRFSLGKERRSLKKVLVLNLGSTSFKFKLYEMGGEEVLLATGGVECIGAAGSYRVKTADGAQEQDACACMTHADALELCMAALQRLQIPIDMNTLDAIGYKAVHGGALSDAHVIDEALLGEMERMAPLAPAHNPVYIAMMKSVRERYPTLTQIACFETAFHQTMPLERAVYGIPYEWMEQYGLRRYGFHGSSHSYIAWKMQQEAPEARRVISVHLGGSSSLCAIRDGKSIATSMGATPQSGVFHNNRVGDMDVFCLKVIADQLGGLDNALGALSARSGFLGLSGVSNDMREIKQAAQQGNARAELAISAFADEIVGYIGMFTAYLGGVDAIAFTGGMGLNDADLRRRVVKKLGFLNAVLDDEANQPGREGRISAPESGVALWVLETNEELMVARGCVRVLG